MESQLKGKTVVISGATSGLGQGAALDLGRRGARVICLGRDIERGAAIVAEIQQAGGSAEFVPVDLLSIADTRRVADELVSRLGRIDVLINNAGGTFRSQAASKDGFERTFALNTVAAFALASRLRPALRAAKGRVVNLATGLSGGTTMELADLRTPRSYSALGSYSKAKLAAIMLTLEQAERWKSDGITSVVVHPGIIPGTRFGSEMPRAMIAIGSAVAKLFGMASTPEQAQERYRSAAFADIANGSFIAEGKAKAPPKAVQDAKLRAALWENLETAVGA